MANIEEIEEIQQPKKPLRFDWVLPVLFRPARALREVVQSESSTWLTPLLILSLLVIISALVAGPIRTQIALSKPPELPADFQYWSPDAQQKYMEANQPNTSPLFMVVFPALGALARVWIGWFLLAAILHMILTLSGSRGSRSADFSLAGWSMLPYAIRTLVQIVAMLVTHRMVTRPGLSGFLPADATGGLAYLGAFLGLIDLYLIWQIVLLIIGASAGSGLQRARVSGAVLATLLIFLALEALPGFIGAQLSTLTVNRPFFLF
jgi:hypothetical protein